MQCVRNLSRVSSDNDTLEVWRQIGIDVTLAFLSGKRISLQCSVRWSGISIWFIWALFWTGDFVVFRLAESFFAYLVETGVQLAHC